jgi:mono/diheme cytochrome c family protein
MNGFRTGTAARRAVRNPDGTANVMPAFEGVLAREQIWLAITYLQSLDVDAPE